MMELLVQNKGGGAVESAALVEKAKNYYTNRRHCTLGERGVASGLKDEEMV